MRSATVYFDLADTSDATFDRPIEVGLVALLAFCPLAVGAVQAWSESVYIAVSLLLALTLAIKLLMRPDVPFVRSWTYWLIALFVALVGIQLLPLPAQVIRSISPQTYELKSRLLSDLPNASERLKTMTLSFYPEATLHDLRLLLATICVFVVTLNCIRRVSQIRWLLGAIASIAAVFAIIALVQDAFGTNLIYGLIPTSAGSIARSGPFVNHSHFGQYMNLSIGAALALALVLINQHFRRDNYTPTEVWQKLSSVSMRPAWLLLGMVIAAGAAVMFSLSRGAMLSAAIAGTITCGIIMTRRGAHGRGWMFAAVLLCIAAIVLLDTRVITDRLMKEAGTAHGNRFEMWRDLSVAWKKFPVLGTGLGTHAVIFPMFDRSNLPMLATHAENEYAQLMTETGAVGLGLAVLFIIIVIAAMVRAIRGAMSPASSAALGLMYGLVAVLAHSFTDFGQHVPAVAMLTAVTCALLLNLGELRWRELGKVSSALPRRGRLVPRVASLVVILALSAWLGIECYTTTRADQWWSVVKRIDTDLQRRQWIAENPEYTDILRAAGAAADFRPKNAIYQYWLNFYRYKSITRVRDPNTGAPILLPQGREHFRRIIDELHNIRWLCPTYGPNYLLSYGMEARWPEFSAQAQRDISIASELCGPDPEVAFQLAQREAMNGNVAAAKAQFQRALMLNRSLGRDVMQVCVNDLQQPTLAMEIAGDEPDALNTLADILSKSPAHQELMEQARKRAINVVFVRADLPDASASVVAQAADAYMERGDYDRAIQYFHRALSLDYGQTDWRMHLALCWEKLGRNDKAIQEARKCLTRRSEMPEARALIARLSKDQ